MTDSRPAALFDYDYTLLASESLKLFMTYVFKKYRWALLELPRMAMYVAPYNLRLISKERMKTKALRILRHVPAGERQALIQDFCAEVLAPRHYTEGLDRIRWHKDQGHLLILASASVDTYLQEVQRQLGFDVLVCTRTAPGDIVTGTNCWGPEKVNRLRELDFFEHTDWSASWAYSDHLSDLPMLLLGGHPVATNPHRALRRHAQARGWEIVDWYIGKR